MKLIPELFTSNHFTLLTAPVAAGKTRQIIEFYRQEDFKIIFVSPLRALANEIYEKLGSEHKHIYLLGGKSSIQESMVDFLQAKKSFLVATMELLNEEFLEAVSAQKEKIIFVLDEFHLIYMWGQSFRLVLHDRFLGILNTGASVLGLTATMSDETMTLLKKDLSFHCDLWFHIDFGNQQLFRPPQKIHTFSVLEKAFFARTFWRELRKKPPGLVYLVFCSYRGEVDELANRARRLGFTSIGCVGGEVEKFLCELEQKNRNVDIIFSTTSLSHGVNLPEISKVFINYEVGNFDFWLQMVGRGGRQGGEYEVYTFDKYHFNRGEFIKNRILDYWHDWIGI
jgi:superfamily II DNA or RNA helicase